MVALFQREQWRTARAAPVGAVPTFFSPQATAAPDCGTASLRGADETRVPASISKIRGCVVMRARVNSPAWTRTMDAEQ